MAIGPDPNCFRSGGFSTYLESGPVLFGAPEVYACEHAIESPDEGGGAILVIDVPDDIVELTFDQWFTRSQGLVQFDEGKGLEELRAAWPMLRKEIRLIECQ
jgi:hypothetical protein